MLANGWSEARLILREWQTRVSRKNAHSLDQWPSLGLESSGVRSFEFWSAERFGDRTVVGHFFLACQTVGDISRPRQLKFGDNVLKDECWIRVIANVLVETWIGWVERREGDARTFV